MKAIKMIGLTALLALLAMAFVGASSAMAESTQLCQTDPGAGAAEKCLIGSAVTSVHEESVGKAKLLTSFGTTECNVLFGSTSVGAGGAPQLIVGKFTYTNCELLGGSCTATEENGPSTLEVLKEGHEKAKVTGKGLVHLVCGSSIDCSYNGTGLVGTAKGPLLSSQTNGEVTLSGQTTTKEAGGFLCPKEAKLDITTTPLTATYIAGAPLMACIEVNAGTGLYKNEGINGVCSSMTGTNTRDGNFELAAIKPGVAVGEMVCGQVETGQGFWLKVKANETECETQDGTRLGNYELGVVKNVL